MSNIVPTANPTSAPAAPNNGQVDLPVKDGEDFIAEAETMDLTSIKTETFLVGVSTGDRNKVKMLYSSAHGPYNYAEMLEQVGSMYNIHQHHAKVIILTKDATKAARFLSENTVDYIEAHYQDLVMEEMLTGGQLEDGKEYTCKASVVETISDEDPRRKALALPGPKVQEDDEL
jgi:hypothetical protein